MTTDTNPWLADMQRLRARTREPGAGHTTLEFKIHCVRPLTEKTGPVRAEGKVVASGKRTATAEGRLVDAQGRLYSHGTTTCLFLEAAA